MLVNGRNQKMNKLVSCITIVVLLFVVASCVNTPVHNSHAAVAPKSGALWNHAPNPNDPFRIPLQYPDSGTVPAAPTGGGMWYDVGDWQSYLMNNGYRSYFPGGDSYPTDTFDSQYTGVATKAFQRDNHLTQSGSVNSATYLAAIHVTATPPYGPMTPYPTVAPTLMGANHHHHHHPSPTPSKSSN
jgi:hypothetical protein